MRQRHQNNEGFTLVEVIATIIVMMLLLPAISTAYLTAARASEFTLHRLRCLGIARQEMELRKSDGYDYLMENYVEGEEPPYVLVQNNFGDSGIDLETTLEETELTYTDESETHTVPALRVKVNAKDNVANVEMYAIVVSGGY